MGTVGTCAFCIGLVLAFVAGCGGDEEEAPDGVASPTAPVGVECGGEVEISDGRLLAIEVLSGQTEELLLDAAAVQSLVSEIEAGLQEARAVQAAVADVHARPDYEPGRLLVAFSGAPAAAVNEAFAESERVNALTTGDGEIDSLIGRLGLTGAWAYGPEPAEGTLLCFSDRLNVPKAAEAFGALENIDFAEPDYIAGDGPDIALEKDHGVWHTVFRDASGDCPAGCIEQTLYYFSVEPGNTYQITEADALADPVFVRVAERWRR